VDRFTLVAFLWGYCEATWFFVIPDVGLTFIALHLGLRRSLGPLVAALLGAALGAVTVYALSAWHWPALWSHFPGFLNGMLPVASQQLQAQGAAALLEGPAAGIPYRVYVWLAAGQGLPLLAVLAWTPLARLPRMVVPMLFAAGFQRLTSLLLGPDCRRVNIGLWVCLWTLIYAAYWGWFLQRFQPSFMPTG